MRQLLAALTAAATLCLVVLAQGCGQTGPLYMPDESASTEPEDSEDTGPGPIT